MSWVNLLGISLAFLGAIGFTAAAQLQHHSVNSAAAEAATVGSAPHGLKKIFTWVRRPGWVAGFVVMCLSIALHLGAVIIAPISLVQPVGILSVPFSLIYTRWQSGVRPRRRVQFGVLLTVAATIAFTFEAAHHVGTADTWQISGSTAALSQVIIWSIAVAFMFLGDRGPIQWRALSWGAAAGILYGLSTANMKHLVMLLQSPTIDWWGVALVLVMVSVAYAVGLWSVQHGYALAPPEVLVACLTVLDPVVAVAFGFIVLGEAATIPAPVIITMAGAGLLAVLGVLLTSWTGRISTAD